MDDEPLVAVRIKDGIFIGNAVAAHDEDFLYMNKVTHVVNCAGAEVPNLYGGAGVEYITFGFRDAAAASGATTAAGTMFDSQDKNVEQVMRFIDRALENGECVMVHCIDGSSRSCAMLAGYFIVKYGWKVNNTLSFLQMAHQDMEIADPWLRQLKMFGKRHAVEHDVYDVEVDDNVFALDNDQWMLRNTLLNGLSAHVQEGSALFRECAAQIQLGDPVYKAPARRRRRLVFVDTHQGTSVGSSRTTPVVKTDSGKGRHADPNDMSHHSGVDGITEILKRGSAQRRQRTEDNAILARCSTPHRRRLESMGDTNAKGRQHLTLRRRTPSSGAPPASEGVRRVPSVGASPAGTRLPASNAPIVRTSSAGGQQGLRPQQYDDEGHRSFHPHPSSTTTTTRQADPPNRIVAQQPQQYSHPSSTVHSRQQSMVSEAESQRPLSHNSGGTLVGDSRHMAPSPRPAYGAPQYRNNNPSSVPQSSVGPRTPFALSSTSKPRVGSPLPQQRRAGSSSTVGNNSMQPQLHTARKTSLTGPSVSNQNSSIYNSSGMRPASPAQRTNTRPSSPTVRTQQSGFESSLVRRASSPLQQGQQPNVPIRRGASPVGRPHIGGGATVVHGASGAASSGTIQPTIRRANSPLQRSSLTGASQSAAGRSYDSSPSGIQRPTYSAQPSSTINRSGIGSRPSSPMQRGLMPATSQPARPSSPNRRPGSSSLADQYLRGGASTGVASGVAAGGIRRGSSPMQRR